MFLTRVEIHNLWGRDIDWTLHEDVNILTGTNGSCKSTVLELIYDLLTDNGSDLIYKSLNDIWIRLYSSEDQSFTFTDRTGDPRTFIVNKYDTENTYVNLSDYLSANYIKTFDVQGDGGENILEDTLDSLSYDFMSYQVRVGSEIETELRKDNKEFEVIDKIYELKKLFIEQVNNLFSETKKVFDEKTFSFVQNGKKLQKEQLSSGEKQILIILLTVLLQERKPSILLLDEPEVSLHITWQQKLIDFIRALNPNCQVIIVTHSATIFYEKWLHRFTKMEDITTFHESVEVA